MYPVPEGDQDELIELWDSSTSMSIGFRIFKLRISYSIGHCVCIWSVSQFFSVYICIHMSNKISETVGPIGKHYEESFFKSITKKF